MVLYLSIYLIKSILKYKQKRILVIARIQLRKKVVEPGF
ncbi:hypothetical protein LEP1GSC052_0698 [Leptospira kmetyi serovar Malaysia str. Bejo-Iso9]|nr:hypothetical protein LEP1GSC052_0698 [Leptospira kmetyi serovar Malaysia str. Bejo-Iso9]